MRFGYLSINAQMHAYVPTRTRSRPINYASSEGSGETAQYEEPSAFIHKIYFDREVKNTFH